MTTQLKLQGKIAIVTGASSGIGAGIAKAMGAHGAIVIVNYASSRSGADAVVASITAAGGSAIAIQADMSKAADVAPMSKRKHCTPCHMDLRDLAWTIRCHRVPVRRNTCRRPAIRKFTISISKHASSGAAR